MVIIRSMVVREDGDVYAVHQLNKEYVQWMATCRHLTRSLPIQMLNLQGSHQKCLCILFGLTALIIWRPPPSKLIAPAV